MRIAALAAHRRRWGSGDFCTTSTAMRGCSMSCRAACKIFRSRGSALRRTRCARSHPSSLPRPSRLRRRNVILSGEGTSVGGTLLRAALLGGAQAAAQPTSRIAVGARADLVILDPEHPSLFHRHGDALLDAAIFAPGTSLRGLVRD